MNEILTQLEQLRQLSGNNQIAYLDSIKTELLKEILEYTYDTHKKYKIDEGKYSKVQVFTNMIKQPLTVEYWNKFKTYLDKLSELKSANDQVVNSIKTFIEQCEQPLFLRQVLFKDLRLNMNTKKFQKVWPTFLVEPQVQLAKAIEDRGVFPNSRYSRKYDGKRINRKTYI